MESSWANCAPREDVVHVPRGLLNQIMDDGACPLHLRMQLATALGQRGHFARRPNRVTLRNAGAAPADEVPSVDAVAPDGDAPHVDLEPPPACDGAVGADAEPAVTSPPADGAAVALAPAEPLLETLASAADADAPLVDLEPPAIPAAPASHSGLPDEPPSEAFAEAASPSSASASCRGCKDQQQEDINCAEPIYAEPIHTVIGPCLALVAAWLPLAEVLALRGCGCASLEWGMQRANEGQGLGALAKVHDRIRTRLWIQRVSELNKDTDDETIFETQVRSFANDALRRRMEAEMAEAKLDMERQIHAFQAEVDRRMEEQAVRVHAIVEERVQQQLDAILATEMEKVRAMVEERVQGRVRAVVQKELHATVCEMQVRLTVLARENDRLRTAFLEHLDHSDLCFRSLVWALSPNATGLFARTLRLVWCCQRRFTKFSAWLLGMPPDRRRERLRARLEALRRTASGEVGGEAQHRGAVASESLREFWGRELEDARRSFLVDDGGARSAEGPAPLGAELEDARAVPVEEEVSEPAGEVAVDDGGVDAEVAAEPAADSVDGVHGEAELPVAAGSEETELPVAAGSEEAAPAPPHCDAEAAAEGITSSSSGRPDGDAAEATQQAPPPTGVAEGGAADAGSDSDSDQGRPGRTHLAEPESDESEEEDENAWIARTLSEVHEDYDDDDDEEEEEASRVSVAQPPEERKKEEEEEPPDLFCDAEEGEAVDVQDDEVFCEVEEEDKGDEAGAVPPQSQPDAAGAAAVLANAAPEDDADDLGITADIPEEDLQEQRAILASLRDEQPQRYEEQRHEEQPQQHEEQRHDEQQLRETEEMADSSPPPPPPLQAGAEEATRRGRWRWPF